MYLIFLQALLWCSNPYLRKEALKTMSKAHFQLILGLGNIVLNSVALFKDGVEGMHMNRWMFVSILNTFFASLCYNTLASTGNASDFITLIQPLVLVLTLAVDYVLFGVRFPMNKMAGCLFIIIGIVLFNYKTSTVVSTKKV